MDAEQILRALTEGNARYASERRATAADGGVGGVPSHRPHAVVVGCSDARVPVERVFDQPPGSLFVVRVAGHVLEPAALASVLYAVRELGVRLVGVLGHQACGAVRAALAGAADEALAPLCAPIAQRFAREGSGRELAEDDAIRLNVLATVSEVQAFLREALPADGESVAVHGAITQLDTGKVDWL